MKRVGSARVEALTQTKTAYATSTLTKVATAAALATMSVQPPVRAEQVSIRFDCIIVSASTCTRSDLSHGQLTITDSAVDPNRVDIDLYVSPRPGTSRIDTLYLNLNYLGHEFLPGRSFSIVPLDAPVNSFGLKDGHALSLDSVGPLGTRFDVSLRPSVDGLTFSGSLVLGYTSGPASAVNLDAEMFAWQDADGLLFAAFETAPSTSAFVGGALDAYIVSEPDLPPGGFISIPPPDDISPPPGGILPPTHTPTDPGDGSLPPANSGSPGLEPQPVNVVSGPDGALQRRSVEEPDTLMLAAIAAGSFAFALRRRTRRVL